MALLVASVLFGALRFGVAVYRAPQAAKGDFAATLPGAYVKALNPTLWNSPDLAGSRGYHQEIYVYGPTQYLFLYPLGLLDSYAQIASVLGVVYAGVLAWAVYLLIGLLRAPEYPPWTPLVIVAVVLLFSPIHQAYIQREFEVVVFLVLVASVSLLAAGRDAAAGALLGTITWFKIWPIAFLGYLIVRKRFRGAAAFVLASCLTLGLGQQLFGLSRFVIFNPSITAANAVHSEYVLSSLLPRFEEAWFSTSIRDTDHLPVDRGAVGQGFCRNWYESEETVVGMKWAVCRLAFTYSRVPAMVLLCSLTIFAAGYGLLAFVRIERAGALPEHERRWRTICEMSLVTIAAALVLSAHYYYFIYLALPLGALAARYLRDRMWVRVGWLAVAYVLLAAFLVPLSLMTQYHINLWRFYTDNVFYLYGELILVVLLLGEYMAIAQRHTADSPLGAVGIPAGVREVRR